MKTFNYVPFQKFFSKPLAKVAQAIRTFNVTLFAAKVRKSRKIQKNNKNTNTYLEDEDYYGNYE